MAKRKKYTEEFKREAVRLLESRGERTISDVAESIGVGENQLHAWRKQHGAAAAVARKERGGETPEEELKRLRRELAQTRQERDLLKKSIAFFVKDSR
jgi:transposase